MFEKYSVTQNWVFPGFPVSGHLLFLCSKTIKSFNKACQNGKVGKKNCNFKIAIERRSLISPP